MSNPFEPIELRLTQIESVLRDLKSYQIKCSNPEPEAPMQAEEAAKFLGISLPTLYTKKSRGELSAYKAPGSKRLIFFKKDLLDYLKRGRVKTTAEIEGETGDYLKIKRRVVK